MDGSKVALAINPPKVEKIKNTVTKKLYGRQKPNLDLKDELTPASMATCIEAVIQAFMIIPASFVFVLQFFAGGFRIGMEKSMETFTGRKQRRRVKI